MTPSKMSRALRIIAGKIDASKAPDKTRVVRELKKVLAAVTPTELWQCEVNWVDGSLADAIETIRPHIPVWTGDYTVEDEWVTGADLLCASILLEMDGSLMKNRRWYGAEVGEVWFKIEKP